MHACSNRNLTWSAIFSRQKIQACICVCIAATLAACCRCECAVESILACVDCSHLSSLSFLSLLSSLFSLLSLAVTPQTPLSPPLPWLPLLPTICPLCSAVAWPSRALACRYRHWLAKSSRFTSARIGQNRASTLLREKQTAVAARQSACRGQLLTARSLPSVRRCPPCRQFTPTLIKCYNDAQAEQLPFELIFLSSDHDEEGFDEYTADMPWPSVKFDVSSRDRQMETASERGSVWVLPDAVAHRSTLF